MRDAATVLLAGVRPALRCLLRVREIFRASEVYYLHNTLYIDDYCVWIQRVQPTALISCGQRIVAALDALDKAQVDLDLDGIDECVDTVIIDDDKESESNQESDDSSDDGDSNESDDSESESESESENESENEGTSEALAAPRPLIVEIS